MKVIEVNYSDFVKSVKELKECEAGWNVVIDLDDGEISVKHNSNTGVNSLILIRGYSIDSEFDLSDENIDGFGFNFIADTVDQVMLGEVKAECLDL